MNKKILSLILCILLLTTITGCNANLTVNGKEIINSSSNNQPTEHQHIDEPNIHEKDEREYTDDDIIYFAEEGTYTLYVEDESYEFKIKEVINVVYNNPLYSVTYTGNGWYKLIIMEKDSDDYFTMEVSYDELEIVQVCIDGVVYNGEKGRGKLADKVYKLICDGKLGNYKQEENKEEPKQEEQKVNKGFYIGSDGMYHCNKCHSVPSKEEYNSGVCDSCNKPEEQFHCMYCGGLTDESTWNKWGGCCSEYCAVQLEGEQYEEAERNGEIGGQTICGWCGEPVYDDGAFCSESCEQAHHDFYN